MAIWLMSCKLDPVWPFLSYFSSARPFHTTKNQPKTMNHFILHCIRASVKCWKCKLGNARKYSGLLAFVELKWRAIYLIYNCGICNKSWFFLVFQFVRSFIHSLLGTTLSRIWSRSQMCFWQKTGEPRWNLCHSEI